MGYNQTILTWALRKGIGYNYVGKPVFLPYIPTWLAASPDAMMIFDVFEDVKKKNRTELKKLNK